MCAYIDQEFLNIHTLFSGLFQWFVVEMHVFVILM